MNLPQLGGNFKKRLISWCVTVYLTCTVWVIYIWLKNWKKNMIVKTCDLPVTREKTVAETSFLCGFRGKGESSNPLTHASVKDWKPWKINGFRIFLCLLIWVRTCDFLWQGKFGWNQLENAFSMILRLSSGVSGLYIYPNVVVVLCRRWLREE